MKNFQVKSLAVATMLALGTSAAASERVIIQVDSKGKGIVKALTKQMGGDIKVDADGFIAAEFSSMDLSEIKGVLKNPHIKLIEKDQIRKASALFNDDLGDPMVQQITPYAFYQAQADQVAFNANAGM